MKVIRSLEKRGNLLKRATRKITSQERRFLSFFRPLMTVRLPLKKSVLTPLAKSVLVPIGLSAGMSAADAAIQNKIYGWGTATLIISNEEMEDIMKVVKLPGESGLIIKEMNEKLKMKQKNKKLGFF